MICKICGNNVADGLTKCDFCGSPIKADALNNYNAVEIDKQQPDSMDMFNIEDTLKVEKIAHEEQKEKDITEKYTLRNDDIDMFPGTQSSYKAEILRHKSEKVSNGNNNVAIYVMLGTIVALVCFIVIILIWPKGNKTMVNETSSMIENNFQNNESHYQENNDIGESYTNDVFMFPSDKEYISEDYLRYKSKDEVAMIRNEIYARHGYVFNTEPYKSYFESQEWYTPNYNFDDSLFNAIEKANKDFIVEYEETMGWR